MGKFSLSSNFPVIMGLAWRDIVPVKVFRCSVKKVFYERLVFTRRFVDVVKGSCVTY